MSGTAVARLADLTSGAPRLVEVGGARIVLTRVGDAVYACADTCAHQGGPLSQGKLSGARLACRRAGSIATRLRTGCSADGGAGLPC